MNTIQSNQYYIEYLSKNHNFKKVRKEFKTFESAQIWGKKNLPNYSPEMINVKFI